MLAGTATPFDKLRAAPATDVTLIMHVKTLHIVVLCATISILPAIAATASAMGDQLQGRKLDQALATALRKAGFTGRIESTLEARLGRRLNPKLAKIGQLLWFDTITGLNDDNTCAGCHSPTHGFGDTQSIAIGIQNNGVVGMHRTGPRNMRRSPMIINTAFYPRLMWNSRFVALSGDPFNNSAGFSFPAPEGRILSAQSHLLAAQAFIPPTERTEVTGFDFEGDNDAIRAELTQRLNQTPAYRILFSSVFREVREGAPITFDMFALAISEFEFTLTFANAPIDQFARGQHNALTEDEKRGALLFFGKAGCTACHAVDDASNEMFSDFKDHVIGVPQISPRETNNTFDGAGANEDYGKAQITSATADRYKFRTSPLRNVAVQSTFMHNGSFTSLEDAVRHHLNPHASARAYSPAGQHLAADLVGPMGPIEPVLARLDPLLAKPIPLSETEFRQLIAFVRNGLLDPRARPEHLRKLLPPAVPSGRTMLTFEFP